jgi:hypothetical protein
MLRRLLIGGWLLVMVGCGVAPEIAHQPIIHNPFPQLSTVAVAPFFNLSDEKTVDGLQFAKAYFAELQSFPGFEVVPPTVVGEAIFQNQLQLDKPEDVRRLANILGVDAVVVGAVTEYSPYYPPRVGLKIEWFAANACFHEIPPGYGLPWGTPEEEYIPESLVFEAEFARAKAQLASRTPHAPSGDGAMPAESGAAPFDVDPPPAPGVEPTGDAVAARQAASGDSPALAATTGMAATNGALSPTAGPDARGLIPPVPTGSGHVCQPYGGAVLSHTRIYEGNDGDLTTALASYAYFRDDLRPGGWEAVLRRDDEFIRFCARMQISEMLSARGGADETRVVWRW